MRWKQHLDFVIELRDLNELQGVMLIVAFLQRLALKSCAVCLGIAGVVQGGAGNAEGVTRSASVHRGDATPLKNGNLIQTGAIELPKGGGALFAVRIPSRPVPVQPLGQPSESRPSSVEPPVTTALFVSSPFGWRSDPIKGTRRRHSGIDLPGRAGAPIYATGDGIVTFAGWMNGYGNVVQIDHESGLRTRFGHLSRISVANGQSVGIGALIGRMGSTGRSTGTHLHYEVRASGLPVDPMAYLGHPVPSYFETVWAPEATVNARWMGWQSEPGEKGLPQSKIR